MTYQIGDRVRCVDPDLAEHGWLGEVGTIVNFDHPLIHIEFPEGSPARWDQITYPNGIKAQHGLRLFAVHIEPVRRDLWRST